MIVSVVIPTYNRAELIREALDSVFAQTYTDLQIVVVDDGSTDHTNEILARYGDKVTTIRLPRSGISAARNAGIEATSGEYIAFLDNDDLWLPEKIEKQLSYSISHPEMVLTYTDAIQFSELGTQNRTFVDHFSALKDSTHLFTPMITEYAVPLMSATMMKASFLRSTGLRFPHYLGIDDLALFLEMMIAGGKFGYLSEKLTMRRMHEGNFSGNHCRRFEQRKLLYMDMLHQPSERYTQTQLSSLKLGMRDARYRVGECYWQKSELGRAREEFLHALGPDTIGMRAAAYGLLSLLPNPAIATLRSLRK
jgi:glycosyltransferase involved in cell wall biosynthesis